MIRSGLNSNATTVGFSPVLGRLSCLQTTRASRASQKSSHTVPQVLLKHISTRPSSSVTPPTSLTSPSAHAVKAGFQFSQWFMLLYTDNNSYYYGIQIQYPDFGCSSILCLLNRLRYAILNDHNINLILTAFRNRGWCLVCTQTVVGTAGPVTQDGIKHSSGKIDPGRN